MPQDHFEETRGIARLPNLDIEIIHGRSADGNAERLSIIVLAVPSFDAFGRAMEAANPFLFWMRIAQTAWAPWLGSTQARLPLRTLGQLPAAPEITGPETERDNDRAGQ